MADRRRSRSSGSRRPSTGPRSSGGSGGSGRVTPKGGAPATTGPGGRRPAGGSDPDPQVQVGRRPSSPAFLLLVGVMWLAVGVVMMVTLSASWKFVPGIVSLGIGFMFLRGAGATELRREHRRSSDPSSRGR